MTSSVVFDTNVLPLARGLDSGLWLSIRKLCETTDRRMVVPELVLHESSNLRAAKFTEAAARFLEAYRAVGKHYDAEPVYVPDVEEICSDWEAELHVAFDVLEVDPVDAAAALVREARRIRPAQAGKGSRDSAIWLTALRLANDAPVAFVSRNTADFGGPDGTLHPDLQTEADGAPYALDYFNNIDTFIESMAEPLEHPGIDAAAVQNLIGLDILDATPGELVLETHPLDLTVPVTYNVAVESVEVLRGYKVSDEEGLLLTKGSGTVTRIAQDEVERAFQFLAWFGNDGGTSPPQSGELRRVTFDD